MKWDMEKKFDFKGRNMKIVVIAVLMIVVAQALIGTMSLSIVFNVTALQIIFAGILISVFMSFPLEILTNTVKLVKESFTNDINYDETIHKIYELTVKIKKKGVLSIQAEIDQEENTFLRDAMILLNDYKRSDAIEDILDNDIESRQMNLYKCHNVLNMIAHIAPAFGLIGTLVGMIGLLANISIPDQIMNNMAAALVSTLYGSLIANIIAVPLMARLKEHIEQRVLQYRIIKEGILLIAQEDTARNVFDKMNVMLKEENRLIYPRRAQEERKHESYEFKV
ncbi:MotA/TolQ/ExbB proton channel [Alkaliphilus metalliredigens QYMF]|uniref:MotA/TolQ/ExbB proton channel n=1 Tax=Alkaliphilus metalliredigens (strain QYMF) TaxID=293826 RepID=A6TK10_ALKMQ|nr:MotA/TolQ/ExbB proton channel family protein [Alkaliphilus metalliredigens]ABR46528.1 MotA/TolQ/ExbB proton channel [Alkaliphilus metalliredigens QYMF]